MTSYFQLARQTTDEDPEEVSPIFSEVKKEKKANIIPPVGIAEPELVESFQQNMGDEEKIQKTIDDIEAYKRETLPETALREVTSHAIRAGEGLLGGVNSFLNLLTPELYQDEDGMPYEPGKQPQGLPGANELREMVKEKTGKKYEPKGEFTKASQETASDIGSMFSAPGLSFFQKLLLPLGGQVTKQLIKGSGGGETTQEVGKLGFMTLSSIANIGNASKVASQAYNDAKNMIPRGLSFSAQPTQRAFARIKNSPWYKSGSTASKSPAMEEISRIEKQINKGMIDGHMAMQLRKDINEARKQLGAFGLNKPANRKQALKYLDEVDDAIMSSMENYGNRVNPKWLKNYKLANEAFRVTERSRLISDAVGKFAKPLQSATAKTLFHVAGGAAVTQLPAIVAAAIPAAGAAKLVQITNRMIRSPVLRNHYLDVLKMASIGNAAAIQKAVQKFDIIAKKEEEKENQKSSNSSGKM